MSPTIEKALLLAKNPETNGLNLVYEGEKLHLGQQIAKDAATAAPGLAFSGSDEEEYVVISVDLDAPFVTTPFLSPIVHWIQGGLRPVDGGVLRFQSSPVIDWLPPSPPPTSGPHRYVFILYRQSPDFDPKKWDSTYKKPLGVHDRLKWDIDGFVKEAGLETMLAATWFDSV